MAEQIPPICKQKYLKQEKESFVDHMLHIILLILKIIGIILLSILGIVLLSILCALFVPVRYRIEVSREEGEDKPPIEARIKITWFLHLINILIRYPADVIVRVRLFIFTIFRIPEKAGKMKRSEDSQKPGQKNGKKKGKETNKDIKPQNGGEDSKDADSEETASGLHTDNTQNTDSEVGKDKQQTEGVCSQPRPDSTENTVIRPEADTPAETEKNSLSDKIRKLIVKIKELVEKVKHTIEKIKALFENIQYTIRNFCDKIKATLDNIQYYREVLESDSFKKSMELCKDEIGYAFRKLKPDKFDADIIVGMDDPATTGQILAFYGMLYPLIGQQIRLVGDFEHAGTHVEGSLYICGRVRAFTFLRVAIRIYFNKDVRKLIKLLKKEAV